MNVYDVTQLSYADFVSNHLNANRPCVVRRFVNDDSCSLDSFSDHISRTAYQTYSIGSSKALFGQYESFCANDLVVGLEKDASIIMEKWFRLWRHGRGTVTPWHYDGNGSDIFNVCLGGSKDFYLSPPDSLPVYPLSSVALPVPFGFTYHVRLFAGDMLYIPSYWFHRVVTLDDTSSNVNFTFWHVTNSPIGRNTDLYILHRLLRTSMCDQPICRMTSRPGRLSHAFVVGLFETFPIFLLYLSTYRLPWCNYAWCFLLLVLIFVPHVQRTTFGTSRLVGIFVCAWILMFHASSSFVRPTT